MPAIIDKEQMRLDIILAFERCIQSKPLLNISLRDIATEAHMTHPKLLNYFSSKEDLIIHYCHYTKDYMSSNCSNWFDTHLRANYESNQHYMNEFLSYVANGNSSESRPNAITQFYVLAQYNSEIKKLIQNEFLEWKNTMEECLIKIYGHPIGKKEAELMMILISGIFICNYNNVLTGEINDNLLSEFKNLL